MKKSMVVKKPSKPKPMPPKDMPMKPKKGKC